MSVELSLLSKGRPEPRSRQVGWVVHRRLLGNGAFDSGFERRKSLAWVEWGEGIPRQGRGCGNSSANSESRGTSAPKLNGYVRSLKLWGQENKEQGKERKAVAQ